MKCETLLMCAGLLAFTIPSEADPDKKSALARIAHHTRKIITLQNHEDALDIDREAWDSAKHPEDTAKKIKEEVERLVKRGLNRKSAERSAARRFGGIKPVEILFTQLQTAAHGKNRYRRTSSVAVTKSFAGPKLIGEMIMEGGVFEFSLVETAAPRRALHFENRGGNLIDISITDDENRLFLILKQASDKSLLLVHVHQKKEIILKGKSFSDFTTKHRKYCFGTLFPILRQFGVGLPLSSRDECVIRAVLDAIRVFDEEERKKIEKLVHDLENDDFETRESATRTLKKSVSRYRGFLQDMRAKGLPPESKMRLGAILKSDAISREPIEKILTKLSLVDDQKYLIALMEVRPEDDQKVLAKKLRELTGQSFGPNPKQWKSWFAEQEKKPMTKGKFR